LVLADFKTADAGIGSSMAFGAGADYVTILGKSGDSTIAGAVKRSKEQW